MRFIVRAESKVDAIKPVNKGHAGVAIPFFLAKDMESDKPFSVGPIERSAMSSSMAVGGGMTSCQDSSVGPGGVQVDLPRWTALMQEAYRAYDAGIVEALRIGERWATGSSCRNLRRQQRLDHRRRSCQVTASPPPASKIWRRQTSRARG